jgi:hypothetical protein
MGALTRPVPAAITIRRLRFLAFATTGSRIPLFLTALAFFCGNLSRLLQFSDRILVAAVGDHNN